MRLHATLTIAAAAAALAACTPVASPTQTATTAKPVPATTAGGAPAASTAAPQAAGDDKLKDVEITGCEVDSVLGWPSAQVKITNHTSKSSNYMVQVEFVDGSGTRISEGVAAVNSLAPGQSAAQKAQGSADTKAKISCKVIDVTRYAALG